MPVFVDPAVKGEPREWQHIWFDAAATNINHPGGNVRDVALADWEYLPEGATDWESLREASNPLQLLDSDVGSYFRAVVRYTAGTGDTGNSRCSELTHLGGDDALSANESTICSDTFGPITMDDTGPEVESFDVIEDNGEYWIRIAFNENIKPGFDGLRGQDFTITNGQVPTAPLPPCPWMIRPLILTIALSRGRSTRSSPSAYPTGKRARRWSSRSRRTRWMTRAITSAPADNPDTLEARTVRFTPPGPVVTITPDMPNPYNEGSGRVSQFTLGYTTAFGGTQKGCASN